MTTLAEDLALLLIDPRTTRLLVDRAVLDRGIGTALLLDLALRQRLRVAGSGRRAELARASGQQVGEPVLDGALARLGADPLSPRRAAQLLAERSAEPVLTRLAQRNLVVPVPTRRLGIFPSTGYRLLDPMAREHLRQRVERVLVDGQDPDVRTACLISLLHGVGMAHLLVDGPPRQVRGRAAGIARGELGGSAGTGAMAAVRDAGLLLLALGVLSGAVSAR